MTLKSMKKVSQSLIVGITKKEDISKVLLLIKNYSIGGVLLYKNIYDSLEDLKNIIEDLHKANKRNKYPLFIAVNHEGGQINSLPSEFKNIPNAYKLGKLDHEDIKKISYTLCDTLSNLGININFSPILDLRNNNDRCYNSNPRRVCEIYDDLIPGYKKYKVLPVVKHFPGIGRTKPKYLGLPIINDYPNKDLIPFEHAINKKCDALLLGHVIIKGKSYLKDITLSKPFINEIRKEYNYKGLIISELHWANNTVIKGIIVGNDIVVVNYNKGNIEKIINRLSNIVDKGLFNIDDSYNRIINIKEKYNISYDFENINIDKYNRQIEKIIK